MTDILSAALPRAAAVIRQGIEQGLHPGAQLYVSLHGRPVADLAIGQARAGVPMRPDTLLLWLSSTKPVAAVAVGQLWERGKLDLDDPVARHIPEFAARGKEGVTIRHILTHTAGFRGVAAGWSMAPWDAIIRQICDARLESGWAPGKKAGYHVGSGWFVLGELVRRLSGRPFEHYVREQVFEPLGMNDSWVGLPADRYRAYGDRLGLMHATEKGPPSPDYPTDTEEGAGVCRPGGNGHGPVRELGRFYEMLLSRGQLDGVRVLSPQTVEALTARHRVGMFDHTFKHVIDWGLGFIVQSDPDGTDAFPYGFGPHAGPRAFGHGGFQSSAGFADPDHGLVVAFVFNGTPGEQQHHARRRALQAAVYEELGLAEARGETRGRNREPHPGKPEF